MDSDEELALHTFWPLSTQGVAGGVPLDWGSASRAIGSFGTSSGQSQGAEARGAAKSGTADAQRASAAPSAEAARRRDLGMQAVDERLAATSQSAAVAGDSEQSAQERQARSAGALPADAPCDCAATTALHRHVASDAVAREFEQAGKDAESSRAGMKSGDGRAWMIVSALQPERNLARQLLH